jgi:secreted PhoX family phosphatase
MSDGVPTPRAHDGMAAFPLPNGNIRLVRNHEDRDAPGIATVKGDPASAYDPRGGGGTTSLEVRRRADGRPELVRDFVSLNGTTANCAGGATPWGTWLSCEETTEGETQRWERDHGYVFEVAADAESPVRPLPLRAMGRFIHEAVALDPRTGIVYETEDDTMAGFYRFIPRTPGRLAEGGRLQMLGVRDQPCYETQIGQRVGTVLPVRWVDIPDPDPEAAETNVMAVFDQGWAGGGAYFSRLEGCFYSAGDVYFHATNGGDEGYGQVWRYRPDSGPEGDLTLIFESPGPRVLNAPDNITVSPRGGILICEDNEELCHLRGLTPGGKIFDLARNLVGTQEFAGATFSPDGQILFVNLQGHLSLAESRPDAPLLGMTFAIWGPWERGAL